MSNRYVVQSPNEDFIPGPSEREIKNDLPADRYERAGSSKIGPLPKPITVLPFQEWLTAVVDGHVDELITSAERDGLSDIYTAIDRVQKILTRIGTQETNQTRNDAMLQAGTDGPLATVDYETLERMRTPYVSELQTLLQTGRPKVEEVWARVRSLATVWQAEAGKAEAAFCTQMGLLNTGQVAQQFQNHYRELECQPRWGGSPHPMLLLIPLGIHIQGKVAPDVQEPTAKEPQRTASALP